jgi:hypothetical protein
MYKLANNMSIIRLLDRANIPNDPANNDYAEYLKWVAAGNSPLPADPVPVVIPPMTPRQVRLMLNAAGLRSQVEAAVAAADQDTKDMWEFSSIILRDDPVLVAIATQLGMTSEQLDSMFIQGALL